MSLVGQLMPMTTRELRCYCLPWFWERPRFWLSSRSWLTWMSLPGGGPSSPWCRVCWGRWRVSSVGTWGTRTSSCSHGYRGWQGRQLSGWRSCKKGVVTFRSIGSRINRGEFSVLFDSTLKVATKHILKLPVDFVDWAGIFFTALCLKQFFALLTIFVSWKNYLAWKPYICRLQWGNFKSF